MSKPAKSSKTAVPGARSRYDDFVAVHINQTLTIHGTVSSIRAALAAPQVAATDRRIVGQLPFMAQILRVDVRTGVAKRVWIPRVPAVLELGEIGIRPDQLAILRRQRQQYGW